MKESEKAPDQLPPMSLATKGWSIAAVATVLRVFAKISYMANPASWRSDIHATDFYARQTALEDISTVFIAFGLSLVFIHIFIGRLATLQADPAEPDSDGTAEKPSGDKC